MERLTFSVVDPSAPGVRALLAAHLAFAREHTPPEDVHALDEDGLTADTITLYAASLDGQVVAVGALQRLDAEHAELKSIHTAAAYRRMGIGRALVEHLVEQARIAGYGRASLETGPMDAFAPSRALYSALGFEPCPPFAGYGRRSVCMTLDLTCEAGGSDDR